jgi:drug/metabolite transporter (DMT)-like permease
MLSYLVLLQGVLAASTAVIWIKLSAEHPVLLASYRCLVAAVALSPLFFRDLRKHRGRYTLAHARRSMVPGLLLALHFMTWILGARLTLAANATILVNMVPLVMPLFLYAVLRERLTRREEAATVLALAGALVMAVADFRFDLDHFRGDLLCFVSMLFYCGYLVLGRKNRDFASIWLYVVPLYLVAGLVCLGVSLCFVSPIKPYPVREVLLILALGLIPTVIGHSSFNYALKHLRGQVVAVATLGEAPVASAIAYWALGEVPRAAFFATAGLVVAGMVVILRSGKPEASRR